MVPAAQDEVDLSHYQQAAELIMERRSHAEKIEEAASVMPFAEARKRERPRQLRIGR